MEDIENKIFEPIAKRISKRADSLGAIRRFRNCGIEGWLKVEAVYALSDMVKSVNNKGPDLTLTDGSEIELKGTTDFNAEYIRGGCQYGVPCLFLADGSEPERVSDIDDEKVKVKASRIISDGSNNWIVGLAAPI